ncbi:MAG: hypothetical protein ACJ762_13655 [Solirubrobacteraceae bacterium]
MRGLWMAWVLAAAFMGVAESHAAEPPGLGQTPFLLTSDPDARLPDVAVDDMGTGHFAWTVNKSYPQTDQTVYCRVPRGATACAVTQTFDIAPGLEAFTTPKVLTPGPGQVVIIAYRCCGKGEGTYAIASADGGNTFAAPRLIGTVQPEDVAYGPGTGAVSMVEGGATAGVVFQAASLGGYETGEAGIGSSGFLHSYNPSIGFPAPTTPIVAYDDLETAYFRAWGGTGDVNDLSTWGPETPIAPLSETRVATGLKGVVLMGKEHTEEPYADTYSARRYDTTTGAFGASVPISNPKIETDVIFNDFFQDPGGNVAAVFVANGTYGTHADPIRYRASTDGGKTWLAERTLVNSTDDHGFNLRVGAAADGGGFVAYDANSSPPLMAVAVPPLSTQGGGGSGAGGLPCVPDVSFGNVQALAIAGCLQKQKDGSYVTADPVRLNGLDLAPKAAGRRAQAAAAGKITVDPVNKKVHLDAVDVKAGNIVLDKGSFDWDVSKGTVASFTHLEKFKVSIFGFPVAGEATLKFDKNGAFIPAHLELPSVFGGITGDVTLRLKNPGGLVVDGFKIHVGQAFLGALQIKPLDVTYDGGQPPVFEGSARFLLPPAYSDPGAKVSFGFINGKFKHAEGSIGFNPPLELAPPWAYLRQIGLALSTDPLKIGGGVELIGGPQILGKSAVSIDALPPQGFSFTFSDPAILKISGSMKVVDIPFASGFVEFRSNGLLKFGGGLDFTAPLGLFSITAGVPSGPPLGPGFVDLSDGRFNGPVSGDVCVPAGCGFIDIGGRGVISSTGFAACGQYLISDTPEIGVSAGFGYKWGQDADVFGGFGGCDIGSYVVAAPARAAQAGPMTVDVPAGLPQENITVTGAGGAPRITVTAPDGEVVASGPGGAPAKGTHMVVYSTAGANATSVLIGKPVAGQYKVEAQPGSPPISRMGHAAGLPEPSVTAKVSGKGHARRLSYKVKAIAGQTVRFVERAAGAGADLGAAKGSKGTLRFSPANGPAGKREVVAMVDQNGAPRRQIVVASYVAPAPVRPGRPAFVRAKRSGSALKVSWGRAARAARYVVRIKLHDGTSKLFVLGAKARSLKIPGVATRTFGSITVAGLTATSSKAGPERKAGVKKKPKKRKRRH